MTLLILLGSLAVLIAVIAAGLWARARLRRNLGADVRMNGQLGLGQFVSPYRISLGVASALIIIQTIFDLAAPWPLKVAVDNVIGGKPLEGWMGGLNGFSTAGLAISQRANLSGAHERSP